MVPVPPFLAEEPRGMGWYGGVLPTERGSSWAMLLPGGQCACCCAHPDPPWGTTTPGSSWEICVQTPLGCMTSGPLRPLPEAQVPTPGGDFLLWHKTQNKAPGHLLRGLCYCSGLTMVCGSAPGFASVGRRPVGTRNAPCCAQRRAWLWEGGSVAPLFFICIIRKGNGCSNLGRSRSRFGGFVVTQGPDLGASCRPASSKLSHDGVLSALAPPRAPPHQEWGAHGLQGLGSPSADKVPTARGACPLV